MSLSKLEFSLICAAKAFISCYSESIQVEGTSTPKIKKNEPTSDSNGIPVCQVHGKAMLPSKYKEGQYYCGAQIKNSDGSIKTDEMGKTVYCKEKGWLD